MTAPSPERITRLLKASRLEQDPALEEETDEALKVSRDTVLRDGRLGKAWLARAMRKALAIK